MNYELVRHMARMLDTGLGREHGFESDADMLEHVDAERAAMPLEARAALERAEDAMLLEFLGGQR